MVSMDRRMHSFIYKRIIISFVYLLVPIALLFALIFTNARQTIREEITITMLSQLNFYRDRLDEEVDRINRNLYGCLSDQEIGALSVFPGFLDQVSHLEYINRIQKRMLYLVNSSSYIEDAYVLIPQVSRKISYNGLKQYTQDEYDEFDRLLKKNRGEVSFYEGKLLLCVSYPYILPSDDARSALYMIVVELSQQRLYQELMQMRGVDYSSELMFYHEDLSFQISTGEGLPESLRDNEVETIRSIWTTEGRYLAVYAHSPSFEATLCETIPESEIFKNINIMQTWMLLFVLIAVAAVLTYIVYLYRIIHKPLNILINSFEEMLKGKTDVSIHYDLKDEFAYIYQRFNDMTNRLDNLIQQVYMQKIFMQRAQLKQLQSQISPHFLYNSFFILGTLSRIGDYETLEKFADQLGEYYQFVTRNAEDDICLSEEVRHARTYTDIQARRFSNRISVDFDELPGGFGPRPVPRLILQPIIENAFLHGIESMERDGRLVVWFTEGENTLVIWVENNGGCATDEELEEINRRIHAKDMKLEVTGMMNIHRRLVLKFGEGSGLTVLRGCRGGFCVRMDIDFGGIK